MLKSLLLGLSIVLITLPAIAISKSEAYSWGRLYGKGVCDAVRSGISTQQGAVMRSLENSEIRKTTDIIDKIHRKNGSNDPLVKAYTQGTMDQLNTCKKEYLKLKLQ